ncbi:PPIC-type PPIASE domain-containing protein [Marinitoga hydrogenitolerans DSM 16785]|uniref:PPIC-type PPIASE domain-containing protein n=1 Tax=Marinitoga hydrogenitolerans (strain DSM 16785 / JCM 12826 / AT1271) TaxID=1122195 RepID=A0A1M4SX68_MARH1|nr:peptidylprolyl isomerase [Marinitoga hydrogenitolerans]SHE36749.1 PPIC-type PPIASE domain-containing protein [Marinitoga hydrogenitolerans DSM 16785]
MKKVVLVLLLIMVSILSFSDVIGYLTKEGKVLQDYSLDDKMFEIEYLNRINSLQQSGQQYDKMKEPYYRLSTIKELLNYKILEYYAKENGYVIDENKINQQVEDLASQYLSNPQTKDQIINYFGSEEKLKDYLRNALSSSEYYKYIDSTIGKVSEKELNEYIKNNFEDIKLRNEKILTKHILVTDESTANKILSEIKSGEISFEDAAKKYSIDKQSAVDGGSINWVAKNQVVPEYFEAAFNANVGDIVGPVKTDYGYHIIKVEGKKVYNTVDDVESDKVLLENIKAEVKNSKLYEWYTDYSKDFSYALKYEPLIYEDRIEKAKTLDEKIDIEKKLYDAIRTKTEAPELWKISYLNLVKELNKSLSEIVELENIILKYKNSEYIKMSDKEISDKIDELDSEISQIKDKKDKNDKMNLSKDLQGLYYAKVMYPELFTKEIDISDTEKYLNELKSKEFNVLEEMYMKNKDMDTLIRLYQLNPDDPQISFEYNYTYYQYIKQYIPSQPKDVIQPELEKIFQAFEKIVSITNDEEIKTKSQKVIEEIKVTLRNMMKDNN